MGRRLLVALAGMTFWLFFVGIILSVVASCTEAAEVTLYGEVSDSTAAQVIGQIHEANREPTDRHITLFIDSPGGELGAGLKIIDAMHASRRPVWTICVNLCASMAAIEFSYGEKRAMFPHAMLMLHHEHGSASGSMQQIMSQMTTMAKLVDEIERHISKQAGISVESLQAKLASGWWLLADDAIKAHLATKIIELESYPVGDK
jgi:ATP-dependent Clp protease protease subunit